MYQKTNISLEDSNSAVIIGGSIAGLIAARILVEHFERVIILERDRLPEQPEFRQGVPQSLHVHALLAKGREILEQLFPGLGSELVANGALETDVGLDWRYLLTDGWTPDRHLGITMVTCSRNLLESCIRQRLSQHHNLEFLSAHQVTGLLIDDDNQSITGVKLKSPGDRESISARLVLDASGRNSHAPQWLESLGYPKPEETVINSFLGYASRWYQKSPDFAASWKGVTLMAKPQSCSRAGVLYPVEDETWIVTLAGISKDYPSTDEAGFLEFARTLRSSEIYETIENAKPISPIHGYRRTENRFRHYEKLKRFPENLIVMGDAACSFNPVYGQGITAATLAGLTLGNCLQQQKSDRTDRKLIGLSRRFQKQLAQVNEVPWLMATSDDLRWSTTIGAKPDLKMRFMHKYIEKVVHSACYDNYVHQKFIEVVHMLEQPTVLFSPKVLLKILSREFSRSL